MLFKILTLLSFSPNRQLSGKMIKKDRKQLEKIVLERYKSTWLGQTAKKINFDSWSDELLMTEAGVKKRS